MEASASLTNFGVLQGDGRNSSGQHKGSLKKRWPHIEEAARVRTTQGMRDKFIRMSAQSVRGTRREQGYGCVVYRF